MTSFAPSLGIDLPYALRLAGFILGVVLMAWPLVVWGRRSLDITNVALFAVVLLLMAVLGYRVFFTPAQTPTQIADAPQSQAPNVKPKKFYSSGDKERLSEIHFKLNEIANRRIRPLSADIHKVLDWLGSLKPERDPRPAIPEIIQILERTSKASIEIYETIEAMGREYLPYIEEIHEIADMNGPPDKRPLPALNLAAQNIAAGIALMNERFTPESQMKFAHVLNPHREALTHADFLVRRLADRIGQRIIEIRKDF